MTTDDQGEGIPQLLGPGGEPLGPLPMPAAEPAPQPAAPESPAAPEAPSAPAPAPETEAAPAPDPSQGPIYRISTLLAVDPRAIPAALITVLNHDPFEAYKRRLDAVRPQFDQSRDVMISATEAQLLQQGAPQGDHRTAATRMVEQNFMRTLWDVCFETVSGAHVSLIFSAGLAGPERLAGAPARLQRARPNRLGHHARPDHRGSLRRLGRARHQGHRNAGHRGPHRRQLPATPPQLRQGPRLASVPRPLDSPFGLR